jgi:hypothetical protein
MKSVRCLFVALMAVVLVGGGVFAQGNRQMKPRKGHVTRVVTVVNPKVWNGRAPAHLTFTGTIFVANPPVEVEYTWVRSDGAKGGVQKAIIRSAGEGFTDTWEVGAPKERMKVWERLQVLSPNNASSNPAIATVNCR